ncbi:YciI family protein [Nonomuraea sp. NPDC050663]|uniref:YciI family protein n=1 Tax=Nonomuraea sp. NPDC050663 TaxID=3364370 RepID=UPI003790CBD3
MSGLERDAARRVVLAVEPFVLGEPATSAGDLLAVLSWVADHAHELSACGDLVYLVGYGRSVPTARGAVLLAAANGWPRVHYLAPTASAAVDREDPEISPPSTITKEKSMKFALIYQYDPAATGPTEEEIPEWFAYEKATKDAGVLVYDCGFYAVDTAQTVQVRDGATSLEPGVHRTGPEVAAGFVVVEVEDAAAAVKWAERLPTARYGSVQIRHLVEWQG